MLFVVRFRTISQDVMLLYLPGFNEVSLRVLTACWLCMAFL